MISIIICSVDDAKFEAVSDEYARAMAADPYELIRIREAASLAGGYAEGLARSKGEIVVFSHDDIEFLSGNIAETLKLHLATYDVIGLAGTDRLVGPAWVKAGPPHIFGQVVHPKPPEGFTVCLFGAPRPVVGGIQALDGVFLAFKREVIEKIGWDAATFTGFHLYDLDCTFRAFQAGYKLAVACDIPIYHSSWGKSGPEWERYAGAFVIKHARRLAGNTTEGWSYATVQVRTKAQAVEIMRPGYWCEQDADTAPS